MAREQDFCKGFARAIAVGAATVGLVANALAGDAERPRDPWVFRSVLDGQARMLTCELNKKLIVAYDTQTCGLRKVWSGDVFFTGGVYDARHGPQPQSQGPAYYKPFADASPWTLTGVEKVKEAKPHYLGYLLAKNEVTIRYAFDALADGRRVTITESPECEIDGDRVTLVRTFVVTGLPAGEALTLNLVGDDKDPPVRKAECDGPPGSHAGLVSRQTTPAAIAFDTDGTYRLRMTWSAQ